MTVNLYDFPNYCVKTGVGTRGISSHRTPTPVSYTHLYGATVSDMEGITGRPANTNVATKLDFDKFWDLMIEALGSY